MNQKNLVQLKFDDMSKVLPAPKNITDFCLKIWKIQINPGKSATRIAKNGISVKTKTRFKILVTLHDKF